MTATGTIAGAPAHVRPVLDPGGVAFDAAILQTESFGPVAPTVTFSPEREAVDLATTTPDSLVSYIDTGDLARGLRVNQAVQAAMAS